MPRSTLDLHAKILAAQLQSEELLRVKMQAKEKLKADEQWEVERAKYELQKVPEGIFVYALMPADVTKEPMHWLCPNCYKDRKKSILQLQTWHEGKRLDGRVCPECNTPYRF